MLELPGLEQSISPIKLNIIQYAQYLKDILLSNVQKTFQNKPASCPKKVALCGKPLKNQNIVISN